MPQVSQATLDSADQAYTVEGGTEQVLIRTTPGPWSVEFTEGGDVTALVQAGGGSGAVEQYAPATGAAGAGGLPLSGGSLPIFSAAVDTYDLYVGPGGAARDFTIDGPGNGYPGSDSWIALAASPATRIIDAIGGAPGRRYSIVDSGIYGSGQGGTAEAKTGTPGQSGQGFAGGDYTSANNYHQGASGGSTSQKGIDGGTIPSLNTATPGSNFAITGLTEEYGRGGKGGGYGGNGNLPQADLNGRDGFGDGAAGISSINSGTYTKSGHGGSGAIILRFALPTSTTVSAGDEVQYTYTVTDTAGNSRSWTPASVTVS